VVVGLFGCWVVCLIWLFGCWGGWFGRSAIWWFGCLVAWLFGYFIVCFVGGVS